jgi:hypothetical protein
MGAFYSPQENLVIGVLETQICPGRGRTCLANISGTRLGDQICPVRDLLAEELG